MEVVYVDKLPETLKDDKSKVIGLYGDVVDLLNINTDISGISYNDEWKVIRLLNGFKIIKNKRIDGIFDYLEMDKSILNKKIKELSKTDLKFILLAYLLINNKKIIIFDYFDVGLSHNSKKKLIKIIGKMKKDGFISIIVSNDLLFMDSVVDEVITINKDKISFNGKISELIKSGDNYNQPILEFINLANKKNANLEYTLDHRELLKDIYRGVGK